MPCTTTATLTTTAIAIKQTKIPAPAGIPFPKHLGEDVVIFNEGGFLHKPISGYQRWPYNEVPAEFLEKFPPPHVHRKFRPAKREAKQAPCDTSPYIEQSLQRIQQTKEAAAPSAPYASHPPQRPYCNKRDHFLCNPYSAYGLFKKSRDWYFDCNVGPRGLWMRRAPPAPTKRHAVTKKVKGVSLKHEPQVRIVGQDELSLAPSTRTAAVITGFSKNHISLSDGVVESEVATIDAFATLTSWKELKEKRSPSAHQITRATVSLMKYC